jgi:hypothetical protein
MRLDWDGRFKMWVETDMTADTPSATAWPGPSSELNDDSEIRHDYRPIAAEKF